MSLHTKKFVGVDLMRFCGRQNVAGLEIVAPFVIDGWRYATDGVVCVRVPAENCKDSKGSFPPVKSLPWGKLVNPTLWPEPAYQFRPMRGEKPVDDWKWEVYPRSQKVAGRLIRPHYHWLIADLPGVRYSEAGAPLQPLLFKFRGGEGLLMPVSRED